MLENYWNPEIFSIHAVHTYLKAQKDVVAHSLENDWDVQASGSTAVCLRLRLWSWNCYVLLNRVPRSLLSFTWVSTNSWHLLTFELYIFEMWFECIVRALFGPSSWLCLTFSPLRQWLHSSRETRPGQAGQRSGCLPRTIWTLHVQCINILY